MVWDSVKRDKKSTPKPSWSVNKEYYVRRHQRLHNTREKSGGSPEVATVVPASRTRGKLAHQTVFGWCLPLLVVLQQPGCGSVHNPSASTSMKQQLSHCNLDAFFSFTINWQICGQTQVDSCVQLLISVWAERAKSAHAPWPAVSEAQFKCMHEVLEGPGVLQSNRDPGTTFEDAYVTSALQAKPC